MLRTQHFGIVACSAPGAALCYQTICFDGSALLGAHVHPDVSMHSPSLAHYNELMERGDWRGVGERNHRHALARREHNVSGETLGSSGIQPKSIAYFERVIDGLKERGCDAVVLGCTEIPLIVSDANSALPTLDSTRLLARAALQRALSQTSLSTIKR